MDLLDRLMSAHQELVEDQCLFIAAQMQAQRRGDGAAASEYGWRLDSIATQLRTVELLINDEVGGEYFVV